MDGTAPPGVAMGGAAPRGIALSRLHYPVTTLGPGRRAGIWFQGCSIHCPGCVSLDTWEVAPGDKPVSAAAVAGWVAAIPPAVLDGITVSGGEPFDQPEGLRELLTCLRGEPALEQADILVYSGYPLKLLLRDHGPVLELLDVVISEPFVAARPTDLPWRGSANQRLTLFTERARRRYSGEGAVPPPASLQVSVEAGRLWMTGIPRRGDMEKFEQMLDEAGIRLGGVSWRS